MQAKVVEETEGAAALRKLQSNELTFWTMRELETAFPSQCEEREIIYYISRQNNFKAVPSTVEIKKRFKLSLDVKPLYTLRKLGLAFNFTIPEMAGYYGLDYLGARNGTFHSPKHLDWSKECLSEMTNGTHGSKLPLYKKIMPENARNSAYDRRWISTLKDENGLPFCLPLGLHIPK
jgi:hypothetical protein